ncbi:hypothetical protein LG3211_1746 [Lysobacter gummosus]|nr:hypothetical protein LG3211_1746 [Lysobacter gummosus]
MLVLAYQGIEGRAVAALDTPDQLLVQQLVIGHTAPALLSARPWPNNGTTLSGKKFNRRINGATGDRSQPPSVPHAAADRPDGPQTGSGGGRFDGSETRSG